MIHRFTNGRWTPGPDRVEGNKPFPTAPAAGTWFNDVTGREGHSEAELVEGLPQLLMKQGAVAELLPGTFDWRGLMDQVRACLTQDERTGGLIASVTLRPDESIGVMPFRPFEAPVAEAVARFALALVRANGQMDFLRREPWFGHGTHQVMLRVDAQLGRTKERLEFHKDTDGDILFNNLVFQNEADMLATEWSLDVQPMAAAKAAVLQRQWPVSLISKVAKARSDLSVQVRHPRIEGGLMSVDGYVSWVEALVWHATPVLGHRECYTPALVLEVLDTAAYSADTADVLVQIAETPGGKLAQWLREQGADAEALSEPFLRDLWRRLRADPMGARALQLMHEDARAIDWSQRKRGTASIAIEAFTPETRAFDLVRQSTGMAGRPRSNSDNLQALLAMQVRDQPRDFFRISVLLQP